MPLTIATTIPPTPHSQARNFAVPPAAPHLTARHRAILAHLWKHPRATHRELMASCWIPSSERVWVYLNHLNHLGYIRREPYASHRTRLLTPTGLLAAQGYEVIWWEPKCC